MNAEGTNPSNRFGQRAEDRNPTRSGPSSGPGDPWHGSDLLRRATMLLRQHTDTGWRAVEADVLARAAALYRPSAPVRGAHGSGVFFVAADVVTAELRQAIDDVPQVVAQRITCVTGDRDELESVTVELIAAFGVRLLPTAERVHAVTLQRLRDLLGDSAPAARQVHTHVHVEDVSNDRRIVN